MRKTTRPSSLWHDSAHSNSGSALSQVCIDGECDALTMTSAAAGSPMTQLGISPQATWSCVQNCPNALIPRGQRWNHILGMGQPPKTLIATRFKLRNRKLWNDLERRSITPTRYPTIRISCCTKVGCYSAYQRIPSNLPSLSSCQHWAVPSLRRSDSGHRVLGNMGYKRS